MPTKSSSAASFACFRCRKGKRKCDRRLPDCSLCASKGLRCEYAAQRKKRVLNTLNRDPVGSISGSETSSSPSPQRGQSVSYGGISPSVRSSSLAAIYFLDVAAFRRARLSLQQVESLKCSKEVNDMVGSTASIRATAKTFFQKVHLWMPIISKSRFYQQLLHPLSQQWTELSLLVLCMRLVSSPFSSADAAIYQMAKRLHAETVAAGILSVDILQSGILLALYEVGHAIYPAAFLSVGTCARYGAALDIDKAISPLDVSRLPWNEVEERRRVWWAILVLDRFVNFGNPLRTLATKDPDLNCYLPVDDAAWDDGSSKPEDAITLSSESNLSMGRFARLAQSVRFLSCTLDHVADCRSGRERHVAEAVQLRRTLLALVSVFHVEESERRLELCTQSAVCYSAILILDMYHETHGGLGSERPLYSTQDISPETEVVLKSVNDIVPRMVRVSTYTATDYVSPFALNIIYMAATLHLNLHWAQPSSLHKEEYQGLRGALETLSHRWRSAGTYLEILQATEETCNPYT